jgi:Domain of Unknown Function (DUF1080)
MKMIRISVIRSVLAFAALFILFNSCSSKSSPDEWEILFEGTGLENWDTYLGAKRIKEDTTISVPLGLNTDTSVFKIVNEDGEAALRISGEIWGGISTKREFQNYHLQLQFKWGKLRWYPKENDKRDSGLLYHGVGEHGKGDGYWLRSQEFQVQEGDCGDYWGVAGAGFDVKASMNADSVFQYDPKGSLISFSQSSQTGRHCKKYPDAEKPSGKWNTIDLYCFGNTSVHVMNGTVVMVLQNSRQSDNGSETELIKGKIQLQSESAEVFYRNIKIRSIDSLPLLN